MLRSSQLKKGDSLSLVRAHKVPEARAALRLLAQMEADDLDRLVERPVVRRPERTDG